MGCPSREIVSWGLADLPSFSLVGLVEGVQTVGREYFSIFFGLEKGSLLYFLSLAYYL